MNSPNFYEQFWHHGYKRLMVVSPHDDPMRYAGKRPARPGPNGWYGVSVREFEATLEQLPEWNSWGGGVGLRCDRDHVGLDLDSMDAVWIDSLKQIALEECGALGALRIGQAPRTMLVYRVEEQIDYRQLSFDDGTEKGGLIELIAGETRWFVVHGIHPRTRIPYSWPNKVPRSEELPVVTKAQLAAFFTRLEAELPAAKGGPSTMTDRAAVEQRALVVEDLSIVRRLVEATPNRGTQTRYEHWLQLAAALRAVSQDDPETGEEIFLEFSERTDLPEITEDPIRVYRSLNPPFAFGMSYLLQFHHKRSDDAEQLPFQAAVSSINYEDAAAFNAKAEAPKPDGPREAETDIAYAARKQLEAQVSDSGPAAEAGRFKFLPFDQAADLALGEKSTPLIKGLLDAGAMSVMYGDSNTGKTFVAMDMAFHIGAGLPYAGMKTSRGAVVYIAAEGGRGAKKRLMALRNKYGAAAKGIQFFLLATSVNLRDPNADLKPLIAAIAALNLPIVFLVVDTMSRALAGGDENSSVDVGSLVKNFDTLRASTGAHLMVVHHSGKDRARGARGWSGLRAATDTELEIAERVISVEKQRDLDKEWTSGFQLEVQTLGLDADGDAITSCTVRLVSTALVKVGIATATELDVQEAVEIIGKTNPAAARGVTTKMLEGHFADNKSPMTSEGLRYHLRQMEGKGLIERAGRGVWRLYSEENTSSALSNRHFVEVPSEGNGGVSEDGIFG